MMRLLVAWVWLLVSSSTTTTTLAWTTAPTTLGPAGRPVSLTRAAATVEAASSSSETTTTTTSPVLDASFQAALDHAQTQLQQAIPEKYHSTMLPLLAHFVKEYITATQVAARAQPNSDADDGILSPPAAAQRILTAVQYGLQYGTGDDKYVFDVAHTALRGNPEFEDGNAIDFYKFGCDIFRPVMDLHHSAVLGQDYLQQAVEQVKRGENVVLLANHQSEADPQVVSCCFEKAGFAEAAANMVYVAGHKVTTDPLAIPFSMGRNLICIHSKKHIDADPATKPAKQQQNMRSINALLDKFKAGGCLLWVAPSGGRDRRNVEAADVVPLAPFDSKTIDIFRLMGNKSKVKTHYYTLAMVSYDLCPPPDYVEAGVGEQRNVRFVPVGIAMGPELMSVGGLEHRHDFCKAAMEQCQADYERLLEALKQEKQQQQ